jgi:ABC-type Fe3+/spermidine/putrescine transport system ATPase subunit
MVDILEIRDLTKLYGTTAAVQGVTLNVRESEIVVILGPSGSGKSTLLKVVAGLINPSAGEILLRGRNITHIPIHNRNLGLVMQGYLLFPHLTAYENVAYSLRTKMHRRGFDNLRERVSRMFELTGLTGLERRKPHEMSGGQQQRVALARALVFDPDLLLLDEPLGALDRELRERMELEIRRIQRALGTTVLYVTHDQGEAMRVADRIAVFKAGTVAQVGTAVELYQRPASQFVAEFLGGANIVEAAVVRQLDGRATLQTPIGELQAPVFLNTVTGQRQVMMVRPECLRLDPPEGDFNRVSGILIGVTFLGNMWRATVTVAGDTLWYLNFPPEQTDENLKTGRPIDLYWKVTDTHLVTSDRQPVTKE